jgi:hypothetical protein
MQPLPFLWDGENMILDQRFRRTADEQYTVGERYRMEPVEDRSAKSHSHEFAWLKSAWATLPEHLALEYPTEEHLRKRALIATGWCTMQDFVCATRAEAQRTAATLRSVLDDYSVVIISDAVVRVCQARSQARNRMNKADFQASKTDVLEYVANLLGVDPKQVEGVRFSEPAEAA